jgi:hypothetical protein
MSFEKSILLLVYIIVSVLLVWSAFSDWKTRLIPRIAGMSLLVIGLCFLLFHHDWVAAGYYVLVVVFSGTKSNNRLAQIFIVFVTFLSLLDPTTDNSFIIGFLFTIFMFQAGIFGGGDAKIALALLAISRDWTMFNFIYFPNVILAIILIVKTYGIIGIPRRFITVLSNIKTKNNPSEQDYEAIWFPWAIIAAPAGVIYIWMFPGIAYR